MEAISCKLKVFCLSCQDSKTVLVTGSSSGIGAAMCFEVARRGARRVVMLSRNREGMERVRDGIVKELSGWDGSIEIYPCDLSSPSSRRSAVSSVLSSGPVDVLVNNAGYSQRSGFLDLGVSGVRSIFEVNFFAGVDLLEMCLPSIRGRGGSVIWVGSAQGMLPLPGRSGYAASKHAVAGFVGSVRAELEGEVDVAVVNPGYVRTNLSVNAVGE
ncbi:hypothetical protein TrRE_jg9730, partial [Triparma retinervis]